MNENVICIIIAINSLLHSHTATPHTKKKKRNKVTVTVTAALQNELMDCCFCFGENLETHAAHCLPNR